jgi:CRISPR-associated endonuclease/helicase Cas3
MTKNILDCLRAKSREGPNFLLKDHLKEVLLRVTQFQEFVNKNKDKIEFEFNEKFFKNLAITMLLHDMGKIDFGFQNKVFSKDEKENHVEEWERIKEFFNLTKQKWNVNVKHEVLSIVYSYLILDNSEWDAKVRTAILMHHYNDFYAKEIPNFRNILDTYPDIKNYIEFLKNNRRLLINLLRDMISYLRTDDRIKKNEFISTVLKDLEGSINLSKLDKLVEQMEKSYNVSDMIKFYEIDNDKPDYEFLVFLGTLRRCDYSASGEVDIEKSVKLAEEIYKDLLEKIKSSINIRDEIWQEKILESRDSNNLILVAPTGSGKSEFALLWSRNRGKKLIYTLPLRVALNDLFWRFAQKEMAYFNKDHIDILHSTSFIEYLKEERQGSETDVSNKMISSRLFSSPLLLTTPDQVFLSSLKYYGSDKLLGIYPLSSIVIDEIQAYNPEMAAIIIKSLEIIRELQGNILIITATFPPYFEKLFKEKKIVKDNEIIDVEKLPEKNKIKGYSVKRHKIKTISHSLFRYAKNKSDGINLELTKEGFDKIKDVIYSNGNKNIMIILNNVGKAIELYKKLEENLEDLKINEENLYLLHSRLIEKEKSLRINNIKIKLDNLKEKVKNKDKIGSEDRLILVATQIVEASVDVDFDILITEISPIDSQIQRWGRIWRNRFDESKKEVNYEESSPNIYVFIGEEKDGEQEIDIGTKVIYDVQSLAKTVKILKNEDQKNKILAYEDERKLINEVYSDELLAYYEGEIKKNLEWLKYFSAEKRSEAQKIFRNIAGIQVVIPSLMLKSESKIENSFGEIIKDKGNWKLPWDNEKDSIVGKVKEKIVDVDLRNKVNKWELLKILYSYSFNLPIFSYEKHGFKLTEHGDFKGFFVLRISDETTLTEIVKYGINKLKNIDIDGEEIKLNLETLNII